MIRATVPPSPPLPPAAPGDADAATRPDSLWPASTQAAPASTAWGTIGLGADTERDDSSVGSLSHPGSLHVCHPALAWRAVLGVQLCAALVLLLAAPAAHWLALQGAVAFAALGATLLWLAGVCAAARLWPHLQSSPRAFLTSLYGAGLALSAGAALQWAGLVDAPSTLRWLGLCAGGALLAAALWAWLERRSQRAQPAEARARLAELQSRIRPHFLFNALNTAAALVRVDPAKAEAVLEDLSELFREALSETGSSVSLDEEIHLAQRYLAIEAIRFGPRLRTEWAVDARAGRARLPPLALQPLVENAVRHGVEPSRAGGLVRVAATVRAGQVLLLVSSPVPEDQSAADRAAHQGHGMALANVRERLRLLHDVAASLDTWQEGGRFHARIVVPL